MVQEPSFEWSPGFSDDSCRPASERTPARWKGSQGGGDAERNAVEEDVASRLVGSLAQGLVPLPRILDRLEDRSTDVQSERVKRLVCLWVEHADMSRDFIGRERRRRGSPVGV